MSKASAGRKGRKRNRGTSKDWKRSSSENRDHKWGPDGNCIYCGVKIVGFTPNQRAKASRPCIPNKDLKIA